MELQVGDKAPEFSLPSSRGEEVSLVGLKGKKIVLFFYPKDDTPGCTKEACGFRDFHNEITESGTIVFGISADGLESHGEFISKFGLNYALLSDIDHSVANDYGAWGEKSFGGHTSVGILRKTFLIDENGYLNKIWPLVTPEDHAREVLEAIHAT
mgnify:CR=1 FL=1